HLAVGRLDRATAAVAGHLDIQLILAANRCRWTRSRHAAGNGACRLLSRGRAVPGGCGLYGAGGSAACSDYGLSTQRESVVRRRLAPGAQWFGRTGDDGAA